MSAPSFFLEAAGARLEARALGASPAGRPTLVFLHEGLGSVAQWKDFPDRVCDSTGLGALVYGRRGHGRSDPVPTDARPVRFMHDEATVVLPAVLDAAGLASVILIGHSDGASISLLFAAEDAGKRARAVVAIAPHLFVEDLTVKSITGAVESWKTGDFRRRLARYHGENVDGAFLGWSGVWLDPAFRAWNIEREAARIAVPVLAVQGEDDPYGTVAQVEALARAARGHVEIRMIARCGHEPQRDQPDETLEAIAGFVRRVSVHGDDERGA